MVAQNFRPVESRSYNDCECRYGPEDLVDGEMGPISREMIATYVERHKELDKIFGAPAGRWKKTVLRWWLKCTDRRKISGFGS